MRSVGLDLGMKEVAFCEVRNGEVVARKTVRKLEDLALWLDEGAPRATIAIEACREAWHVHDELVRMGHEVLVVDTTRAKQLGIGRHGRKFDALDAECLGRAVDEGRVPRAHVLSPAKRALRQKVNTRHQLVEMRAALITSIRGIARAHGERIRACDTEVFRRAVASAPLTPEVRADIAPMMSVIEVLDAQLSKVESELEALAEKEPAIANLTSAIGVNLVVAAGFASVIDNPKRFKNAHQVESYIGLVPREDTTGGRDKRKLGSITKCGNAYVRSLLVQAAWCILRGRWADDPVCKWARAVAARRGKRVAVVAAARRLAGVLWAMWRDDKPYDPAHLARASARGLEGAAAMTEAHAVAMRTIARKASARVKTIHKRLAQSSPTTRVSKGLQGQGGARA